MAQQTIDLGASPGLGDTLGAALVKSNNNFTELYTKLNDALQYVETVKNNLDFKESVRVASTAPLSATASSTLPTLTNTGTKAALVLDGVAVVLGDRVLIKDQDTPQQNGIYTVTEVGSGTVNWVLTRSVDFGAPSPTAIFEVKATSVTWASGKTTISHQHTNIDVYPVGSYVTLSGFTPTAYNASWKVTTSESGQFTFTSTNLGATSGSGLGTIRVAVTAGAMVLVETGNSQAGERYIAQS